MLFQEESDAFEWTFISNLLLPRLPQTMVTLFPPEEPIMRGWTVAGSLFAAGMPAAIYAFQNLCITTATRRLEPLVFNCLNQTKILWTALFLYFVMSLPAPNHPLNLARFPPLRAFLHFVIP